MKTCFGWLTLANIAVYLGILWGNGVLQVRTLHEAVSVIDHSAAALLGVVACTMCYDKFADRVTVYEAMEEGPDSAVDSQGKTSALES